jgi:predicted phosphodiesterase
MIIGFVSDIHEDIDSLKTAFVTLERLNCDAVVCLGDIVGFTLPFQRNINGRDANACIAMVREQCAAVVAGNHDLYAVRRIPEFSAGFPYGDNWYELDYDVRAKRSRKRVWLYEDSELPHFLSGESAEYLRSLPEYLVARFNETTILLSHYHYPDCTGSTIDWPKRAKDVQEHFRFMYEHGCAIGVSGHGHPEGYVRADERLLKFYPFGSYELERTRQWIVCPCIANTSRANGVLLFDTVRHVLDVIPLGSRRNNRAGIR